MSSPTARSLEYARELGYEPWIVERRKGPVLVDLYGFLDILLLPKVDAQQAARSGSRRLVGLQVTTGDHHADRLAKMHASPFLEAWLASGCEAWLWSWSMKGKKGNRKLWTLRAEVVTPLALPAGAGDRALASLVTP